MTEQKKIRLSAQARHYNVGGQHLVEFLEKHSLAEGGVNPNTILSDKQLAALDKEFGGEKTEKIDIRQAMRVNTDAAQMPNADQSAEAEPVRELSVKTNTIFVPEVQPIAKPKVLGKIDLDAKKAVKEDRTEPKTTEKPAVTKPSAKAEVQPQAKPDTKTEVKVEVKDKVEVKAKTEAKAEIKAEVKLEKAATEAAKEPAKKAEATPAAPKKAPETAPVVEPAAKPAAAEPAKLFRAADPEKLAGPKILGKMVLPVADSGASRGKRNRIKKNKVDITAPAAGGNAPANRGPQAGGAGANANRPTTGGNKKRGGKNQPRAVVHAEVSEEDVQKQIKETLARLTGKGGKTKSSKYRRDKREAVHGRMAEEAERQELGSDTLQVTEFVTVQELATMMDVSVNEVIAACMNLGLMVSINQRLDAEALVIVAEEFGFKVEFVAVEIQEAIDTTEDIAEDLEARPPIVTVMGHVDHGKTSLLDYIRKANVIAGEAGGITQHIGAYSVKMDDGRKITFLDTPGHEAFTAMRARGAKVTDIAIIIVAADDAIMPQTREAINHAEAAGVPIVFAINKIDKPGANVDKIKEQLSAMNYLVEDWGGKYQSQDISAKSGLNVESLLEKIVLQADLLELKANPNRKAMGSVIESTLDKGRGYVTTILVHNGTLHTGDVILSGIYTGRVKAMFNERGKKIDTAGPATPVLVLGLNGAPQAGDTFNVMDDDKAAREIATKREQLQRMQGLRTQKHITLDEIGRRIAIGSFKELNIIVKGDVDGSIEALTDSLIKLSTEEVQVNVIHKAVGAISESDVLLAAASNAIIVGFQVRPMGAARKLAEKEQIDIRLYSIIYDAIEEIKDAIEGMLAPETKEEITSSIEVLETFKITKVGTVAGCIVREGKIVRGANVRVIRDGIVVYTGRLSALKRFKEEVKEVTSNIECGLSIESYNDIKVGDFVESYTHIEVARKL